MTISSRIGFTVNAPESGVWRLQLVVANASAPRTFAVTARGNTRVAFHEFEFVRLQEGVHGGYFGMDQARLIAGAAASGRARLSEPLKGATFRLVDEAGATLQAPPYLIVIRAPKGDAMSLVPFSVDNAPPAPAKR